MEFVNATRMVAGYTMSIDTDGREQLVIVVKGTFGIPQSGDANERVALAPVQQPLVLADTFTGEPGLSAPVFESDFAPRKTFCDVLLVGTAYAPAGRPATRLEAGISIGSWSKRVSVVGPRQWDCGSATLRITPPRPFLEQALSYDVAFGGCDLRHDDSSKHAACMTNPVGRGFHKHLRPEWVDGQPLPSIEEPGRAVTDPDGDYRPMAFGPVGRGWLPRSALAGTYDAAWLANCFPFLPPDFDPRYHQAAPSDQQLPLTLLDQGTRDVLLTNLTPSGTCRFTLPRFVAPVHVYPKSGGREYSEATLDTLVIQPDDQSFTMTWRATRPLRRNIFELAQVVVGTKGRASSSRGERSFPIPVVAASPSPPSGGPQ